MVHKSDLPTAVVEKGSHLSLVWIIPLVAVLIASWLIFKVYSEKGDLVTITFDNAEGIEVKKTVVRYKDVTVGKVTAIDLDKNLERVEVTVEIFPSMAEHLGPESQFWVVRPIVTLSGISGLSTLISGIYIGMDPGVQGKARKVYPGLDSPPRVSSFDKGATFTLEADRLGTLDAGSPVYYRQIQVGEVVRYELTPEKDLVQITVFIKAPFHTIVKQNTQFWNISGLEVNVSPSGGVEAKMGSLASLLIGGVTFETPHNQLDRLPPTKDTVFPLYRSHEEARDNTRGEVIYYVLYFEESLRGLVLDSPVEYRGIKVGHVQEIRLEVEEYEEQIRIPVQIVLYAEKLSVDGDPDDAQDIIQHLVEKEGLRAQLTVSNFLTGSQYISLVIPEDPDLKPGRIMESSESGLANEELPTMPGLTKLLAQSATEIMTSIQGMVDNANVILQSPEIKSSTKDLASILEQVDALLMEVKPEVAATIKNVESISGKLDNETVSLAKQLKTTLVKMDTALVEAKRTLSTANNTLDEDSSLQYELRLLIEEVSEAAKSFSVLADTIQRKPNAVIFGK